MPFPEKFAERFTIYWLSFIFISGLFSVFTWPINFVGFFSIFAEAKWIDLLTDCKFFGTIFCSPADNVDFFLSGGDPIYAITKTLFLGFAVGLLYRLFERPIFWNVNHLIRHPIDSLKKAGSFLKRFYRKILRKDSKDEEKERKEFHLEKLNIHELKYIMDWIGEGWKKSYLLSYLTHRIILAFFNSCETNIALWLLFGIGTLSLARGVNAGLFVIGILSIYPILRPAKEKVKMVSEGQRFAFCLHQQICPYCGADLKQTDLKQKVCPNPICKRSLDWNAYSSLRARIDR